MLGLHTGYGIDRHDLMWVNVAAASFPWISRIFKLFLLRLMPNHFLYGKRMPIWLTTFHAKFQLINYIGIHTPILKLQPGVTQKLLRIFNSHLQNKLSQQDCIQVRIYISKFMLFYSSMNKAVLRLASCDITKNKTKDA